METKARQTDRRTEGQTEGRTEGRRDKPKLIFPRFLRKAVDKKNNVWNPFSTTGHTINTARTRPDTKPTGSIQSQVVQTQTLLRRIWRQTPIWTQTPSGRVREVFVFRDKLPFGDKHRKDASGAKLARDKHHFDMSRDKHRPDITTIQICPETETDRKGTGDGERCGRRVLHCIGREQSMDERDRDREMERYREIKSSGGRGVSRENMLCFMNKTHTHTHKLGQHRQFLGNRQVGVSVITNYSTYCIQPWNLE